MHRSALFVSALLLSATVLAAPRVQVVGLFPNAAVVNIDGVRQLLKAGQTGSQGVQLVSADSKGALLRIDGVEQNLNMSREYNPGGYATPQVKQLALPRGQGGHYWSSGSINGKSVQFMIDTGATAVAMSETQARRLGIDYSQGARGMASTGGGMIQTWKIQLSRVAIGNIELLGVDAMVLAGDAPAETLLGMSFLSRVGWREDQGLLYIEARN